MLPDTLDHRHDLQGRDLGSLGDGRRLGHQVSNAGTIGLDSLMSLLVYGDQTLQVGPCNLLWLKTLLQELEGLLQVRGRCKHRIMDDEELRWSSHLEVDDTSGIFVAPLSEPLRLEYGLLESECRWSGLIP